MNVASLQNLIIERAAKAVAQDPSTIDPQESWESIGLDSIAEMALIGELQARLGVRVSAEAMWEINSIAQLAEYFVERWNVAQTRPQRAIGAGT